MRPPRGVWLGAVALVIVGGLFLGCSDAFEPEIPKAYVLPDATSPGIPAEMGRTDTALVLVRVVTDTGSAGKTIDRALVAWTTSDPNVVTVKRKDSLRVKLTAVGSGRAVIVGTIDDGVGAVPKDSLVDTVTVHERWVAVDVGRALSCGLNVDRVPYCWPNTGSLQPTVVPGLFGIPASNLQVGHSGGCVLIQTSSPFCWGRNAMGELGLGSGNTHRQPIAVQGFLDELAGKIRGIAAGGAFTCLDTERGEWRAVTCYGNDTFGQLGLDTAFRQLNPDTVTADCFFGGPHPCGTASTRMAADSISVGENHVCAIKLSSTPRGDLVCWGANATGQLGTPNSNPPKTCKVSKLWDRPCRDTAIVVDSAPRFVAVSAGWDHFAPDSNPPWLGEGHTCAIEQVSSTVFCWGKNDHHQLGAPSDRICEGAVWSRGNAHPTRLVDCRYTPKQITGSARYKAVRAGSDHTCGIQFNDHVYCWGSNEEGQLGDGTKTTRADAEEILILPGRDSSFESLDAGPNSTCAVSKPHGAIFCWGKSIGDTLRPTPERVLDPQ